MKKKKEKDTGILVQFDMKQFRSMARKAKGMMIIPAYSPEHRRTAKGVMADISARKMDMHRVNRELEKMALCLKDSDAEMIWQLRKDRKQKKPRISAVLLY